MRRTRSKAITVAMIVSVSVVALMFFSFGSFYVYWASLPSDIAGYDDSHLKIVQHEAPPDELNAFTYYAHATNQLELSENDSKQLREMLKDRDRWDSVFIEQLLADNEKVFDSIAEGHACSTAFYPAVKHFMDVFPEITPRLDIANLYRARIAMDFNNEAPELGIGHISESLQFAERVQAWPGCLVSAVLGSALQHQILADVRDCVRSGELNDVQLQALQDELKAHFPSDEPYKVAFMAEYQMIVSYLDRLDVSEREEFGPVRWLRPVLAKKMLHPNRTKLLVGDTFHGCIEAVGKPYAEIDIKAVSGTLDEQLAQIENGTINKRDITNPAGLIICQLLVPDVSGAVKKKYEIEVDHSATLLLLVLHRYKMLHGIYPEDLQALVPKHLSKVPRDPFNGKPMGYNSEKALVYSVGEDLIDAGGSMKQRKQSLSSRKNAEDFVFGLTQELQFLSAE